HYIRVSSGKRSEKGAAQDCLTRHLSVCVCRSCQIQSTRTTQRLHGLRRVRNPKLRNRHRPACHRTWLLQLPAFRWSEGSFFTSSKSATPLCVFTRCSRSSSALLGS